MSEKIFPPNKDASPIDWNDLAVFLAIARHGGLSSAAREIRSSPPTLGRKMRALERALGRELFARKTHGYDLTDAGKQLQKDLSAAESTINRVTMSISDRALPIVRIAAGTWTMFAMTDVLTQIVGKPRDLRVLLLQGEDVLSIPRREAAIGFRNMRPSEHGLAGRRLRPISFAPYARTEALKAWIVVRADTPSARWVINRCGDNIAIEVNVPRLALDLAISGLGRLILPTFIGESQSGLVRVGSDIDELAHDQWLATHDEDRALPEVRRALDRIQEVFG